MSSAGTHERLTRFRNEGRDLRLVNWPLRQDGLRPWLLLAMLALAIGVVIASGSPVAGMASLVALLLSAWRLWTRVTFELGPRGIVQTIWGRSYRIAWREFARYQAFRKGVLLLVDIEPTPLDAFRGLFIRYDNRREEVLRAVDQYMGPDRMAESSVSRRERPT
jgi:hypothetical protein